MIRILKRLLAITIIGLLMAANLVIVWFWMPYTREAAAMTALKPYGIQFRQQPLFRPLYCNLIRKGLPDRHQRVSNRVQSLTFPADVLNQEGIAKLDEHLRAFRHLRTMDLSGAEVSPGFLSLLSRDAPTVVRLNLRQSEVLDSQLLELQLPRLTDLRVRETAITDSSLAAIARLTTLERLDLAQSRVTLGGVTQLEALPVLHRLDLRGIRKGSASGARFVPGCMSQLRELYLADTELGDDLLLSITQWASSLEYLDVSQTAISDASVAAFQGMSELQSLNVAGTGLTQSGLESLLDIPALSLLVCDGSLVSQDEVAKMERDHPDLIVFAH